MPDIYANNPSAVCHEHWRDYVAHRLRFDFWSVHDALLLLADVWPLGVEIKDSEVRHLRYGLLEPPVLCEAKLLNQDCNVSNSDSYERLLIKASRRFAEIRELWKVADRMDELHPPSFFVAWAQEKGISPCWLGLWKELAIPERASELAPTVSKSEVVNTIEPTVHEDGGDRRTRLRIRRNELRAQGRRDFNKIIAEEEGVSRSRVKQLLSEPRKSVKAKLSPFAPLMKAAKSR